MTSPTHPKPPTALSDSSKALWRRLVREYSDWTSHSLTLLTVAMEARDRMMQAAEGLAAEGLVVTGPTGSTKTHPLAGVERDSRTAMLQALKQLRLDEEPLNARVGRPPGPRR